MRFRTTAALLAVLALPGVASAQTQVFRTALYGTNEAPTPVTSPGFGTASLVVAPDPTTPGTYAWTLTGSFQGLTATATNAHIHVGAPGVAGGVVKQLAFTAATSGTLTGSSTATSNFTAAQYADLQAGNLYVNLHTGTNTGGELRGQLTTQTLVTYRVGLVGTNEVPSVSPAGEGAALLTVNTATYEWDLSGSYSNMTSNVQAAHIHTGAANTTGPVLAGLTHTAGTAGTLAGAGTFSATSYADLQAGNLYVNVHTVNNPTGEIRDQLRTLLPAVNGTCDDANYQTLAVKQSATNGFGSTNDVGALLYFTDATDVYLCVPNRVENTGNGIAVFMDVDSYSGIPAGTALPATGGGFFQAVGGTILDGETDFALFTNRSGNTLYTDGVRYTTTAVGSSGFLGQSAEDGTTGTLADAGTSFGGAGTGQQAYLTGFDPATAPARGLETRLPLSAFPGVVSTDRIRFFVAIASNTGYFSNELLPDYGLSGTADGGGNFGNDPNFQAASPGVDLYTSPAVYLPVELVSFTGVAAGTTARLAWTTASETNNAGFHVERQTGAAWAPVGYVKGAGTTAERQSYGYDVTGLAAGRHSFRLRQVDLDGAASYSPTVEVAVAPSGAAAVALDGPNPFATRTALTVAVRDPQTVSVAVYDALGRRVADAFRGPVDGSRRVGIDGAGLSAGLYVVVVEGERFRTTLPLTVAR